MTTETGLERVREILFGEILGELERRLAKLENYIATRSNDIQHDARQRTDVLEAHLKKEMNAVVVRAAELEQRLVRSEREIREQVLADAKVFFEELAQLRGELRAAGAREEDEDEDREPPAEQGTEHGASAAH